MAADPDSTTLLAPIRQIAELCEGLALVLLVGPRGAARRGLERVRAAVGSDRETLWHRFDRRGADLPATLSTASSSRPVLLAHGLERLDTEARREVEVRLNLLRDSLARNRALVVLWIAQDDLEDFRRRCPDLFQWRALLLQLTEVDLLPAPAAAADAEADRLRHRYLRRVMASAGALALSGIDPSVAGGQADASLRLDAVDTALLTQSPRHGDQPNELAALAPRRAGALEQLNRHHRLVLLGDPGSGKSTFANFVALCLAGEQLGDPRANLGLLTTALPAEQGEQPPPAAWSHGPLLPVPVILRDFAARGLPARGTATAGDLWRFLRGELEGAELAGFAPYLEQTLRRDGGLVLFDGLDEVPEAAGRRRQILDSVRDFAATFSACRILVTCRTYAYQHQEWRLPALPREPASLDLARSGRDAAFAESVLEPLNDAQIRCFIDRWYRHVADLRGLDTGDARGRAELLKAAIFGSVQLRPLAERPLLLTLMASLHAWRGGSLPEQREELYHDAVQLLLDFWERRRVVVDASGRAIVQQESLAEWLRVDRARVRRLLNRLAFRAHAAQPDLAGTADLSEGDLIARLMSLSDNPDLRPERLIEYLRDRAGLLLARGVGVYTFAHRTFQEYLAACHLTDDDFPEQLAELARGDKERWREVTLLAAAKAARGSAATPWQLAGALGRGGADGRHLAGLVLAESADLSYLSERVSAKLESARAWQVELLTGAELPARDRAECGRTLARLGDPRPEVMSLASMQFCRVPTGAFRMGSESDTDRRSYLLPETPASDAALPYGYWIGRFPVTRAQFSKFTEAGGYGDPRYWPEAIEAGAWKGGTLKVWEWRHHEWGDVTTSGPQELAAPFDLPNHAMVGVSWFEARAFCRWLTRRWRRQGTLAQGWIIALPSEPEWEKAARGGFEIPASPIIADLRRAGAAASGQAAADLVPNPEPRRRYPWGEEIDAERANQAKTGIGTTSAVGCFAAGSSAYGCEEMSGNVWEWTRSRSGDYPYPATPEQRIERETCGKGAAGFVLRGGGFGLDYVNVRCAARAANDPTSRNDYVGFRVVLSPSAL